MYCGYFDLLAFDLHIMTVILKILMTSPSKYCPGQYSETIHDRCFIFSGQINLVWNLYTVRFLWYLNLSPWKYDLRLEFLFWPLHRNYKWQLLDGHIHLPLELCTAGLFLPFDLYITITLKILSCSLLENYKWQMLHIFKAYQTKEMRKTFDQTNMEFAYCHFDLFDPCPWN